MKINILFLFMTICSFMPTHRTFAQTMEVSQLLMNVEKLTQLKKILSQMKQSYSILSKGYGMVKNLSQGNFQLHQVFLQGLMQASPLVRKYHKVNRIVNLQLQLVKHSKQAVLKYKDAGWFSIDELKYLTSVHYKVLKESLANLQELTGVIIDGQLQMNDGDRLMAIDEIHDKMEAAVLFLRGFIAENNLIILERKRQGHELNQLDDLYGIRSK